jgi:hypothetical protein
LHSNAAYSGYFFLFLFFIFPEHYSIFYSSLQFSSSVPVETGQPENSETASASASASASAQNPQDRRTRYLYQVE